VIGKEKKRKKLDEIVLGLSAAKEQKTFPDPSLPSSKKPQIPPSVSVTPANLQSSASQQSNQKPFTITVTTVPGSEFESLRFYFFTARGLALIHKSYPLIECIYLLQSPRADRPAEDQAPEEAHRPAAEVPAAAG